MRTGFDQVIGLGHRCYTASHLRRMMIHGGTMPFDWIMSGAAGTAEAIATRFDGMLAPENLVLSDEMIADTKFDFHHYHDFPITPSFMESYLGAVQRRQQLVDRFFKSIESGKRLLFVRHEWVGQGSLAAARDLVSAIEKHRPVSSFRILYMSDTMQPLEDGALSVVSVPAVSELSDREWDGIFAKIHEAFPIRNFYPSLVRTVGRWPRSIRTPITQFLGSTRKRILSAAAR